MGHGAKVKVSTQVASQVGHLILDKGIKWPSDRFPAFLKIPYYGSSEEGALTDENPCEITSVTGVSSCTFHVWKENWFVRYTYI